MRQYLEGTSPGHEKLAQIARANGVTVDWLATGEEPRQRSGAAQIGLARDAAVRFAMKRSTVSEGAVQELMQEAFRDQLDAAQLERRHGAEYPIDRVEQPTAAYRSVNLRALAAAAAAVEQRMPHVSPEAKAQVISACYERMARENTTDAGVVKDLLDAIAGLAAAEPEAAGPAREHVDVTWPVVERRHKTRRKDDGK